MVETGLGLVNLSFWKSSEETRMEKIKDIMPPKFKLILDRIYLKLDELEVIKNFWLKS